MTETITAVASAKIAQISHIIPMVLEFLVLFPDSEKSFEALE